MSRFDIITIGSSTIDAFMHTDAKQTQVVKIHNQMDLCYPLGAKILIEDLEFFSGGGGTNSAVSFSRMGFNTAFLGMLGNDMNGELILKELNKERVHFIGSRGDKTGYSVVLDSIADDRTIFTFKGCVNDLSWKKINKKDIDSKWIYSSALMKESFKTLEKLSKFAREKGIKLAFNPSLYLAKKGISYLSKVLSNTEVLILNKEESQALLGVLTDNMFHLLEGLISLGPKIAVITDAGNGVNCYNSYERKFYFAKPRKVKIKETTGAGDAFASGFVAGIMKSKSTMTSLKLGMLNAESVIQRMGPKNILLGKEAFDMADKDKRPVVVKSI